MLTLFFVPSLFFCSNGWSYSEGHGGTIIFPPLNQAAEQTRQDWMGDLRVGRRRGGRTALLLKLMTVHM